MSYVGCGPKGDAMPDHSEKPIKTTKIEVKMKNFTVS